MIAGLDWASVKWRPATVFHRLAALSLLEGRPLTARGRWINPLALAFLRAAADGKAGAGHAVVRKPVFIVGVGRSGTTLTARLLSLHRDVALLNEPKALWHVACPQEDLVGNYSRGPAHYRLGTAQATERVRTRVHRLYQTALFLTRRQRIVDKYPEMVYRLEWLRALFPDARFVLLVRDGWSVCRSIATLSSRMRVARAGEIHDWWGANDRKWNFLVDELVGGDPGLACHREEIRRSASPHDRAALEWALAMREGYQAARTDPDRLFTLRYEQLCAEPGETLRRLLEFCQLAPDPGLIERAPDLVWPPAVRAPLPLHPLIEPLFRRTMLQWGCHVDGG